ncbi:MAG: tetratricopeptide repeat protein [Chitinophagaceae bacterium]|nr:MAG: cytochrome c biogenesis factor [Bacteroidetes bacterium OLB11]MCC6447763.1 tetratricopeptide repeat protein [Chitinophagaceae bacterium]HMN33307.1 tetratricopeptide repeat protein [Chitinophagaceae bacterium]
MKRKQAFLLTFSVILIGALYFLGDFKGKKKHNGHTHNEAMNASPQNPIENIDALDFKQFELSQENSLNEQKKATLSELKVKAIKKETAHEYKDIAEFWEKENELIIAAFYYKKAAFLENTEKSITFAGSLYLALLEREGDMSKLKWLSLEAIPCFEKVIELNPNNDNAKVALATCYTEGMGETMKGVTILREITAKDSTNIPANLMLGKMSIQSGQFDKAINRLELVLSKTPENTEAMYFLAEAYKGQGNKAKAISLFEKCKSIVNNPEFSKEIDNYIKTFN